MKTIIAGSRSITDANRLYPILDNHLDTITEVVCGYASGPDSIGAQWAIDRHIPISDFPAAWRPNGVFDRSAGYKRNVLMGQYADQLIAFWDGESRGTKHMIDIMDGLQKYYMVYVLHN